MGARVQVHRGGPEPRSARATVDGRASVDVAQHRGAPAAAHSLLSQTRVDAMVARTSARQGRWGKSRTLQRSHACPVRFESASFLFTEPEKSLLLLCRRWCGLAGWPSCEMPCSMRWILLMLATVASSSDMRFVPEAMMDASAVSSESRLSASNPDSNWPVVCYEVCAAMPLFGTPAMLAIAREGACLSGHHHGLRG